MLFWMLPPSLAALSVRGRVAFGLACGVAIAIEVVGAFWYTGVSDTAVAAAEGPDKMRAAWDIRNASFIAELSHPRAPADLVVALRGSIDLVTVRDEGSDKAERQVEVQGWTLTTSRTPAAVYVMVDCHVLNGTAEFFDPADVVRTLREPSTTAGGSRLRSMILLLASMR